MKNLSQKLRQVLRYPLLCLFVVFMVFVFCMDMTATNRQFSELENRVLNQRPKFSVEKLVANEYTMDYEEYVNDQFIWRDQWITMKSISESALQKIENNSVAFGQDGYLFERYTIDRQQMEKNLGFVQEYLEKYPDQHVTFAAIPNSLSIHRDKTPAYMPNAQQHLWIDELYGKMDAENVDTLDLHQTLRDHNNEYI